jgi:hypothetical protein
MIPAACNFSAAAFNSSQVVGTEIPFASNTALFAASAK